MKATTDDAAVREIIADRYCAAVSDRAAHRSRRIPQGQRNVDRARGTRRATGGREFRGHRSAGARARERRARGGPPLRPRELAAAAPLTLSQSLTEAASRHALDMARTGSFDHRGSDGSSRPSGYRAPDIAGERPERTSRAANRARTPSSPPGSTAPGTARTSWDRSSRRWAWHSRWRRRVAQRSIGRRSLQRRDDTRAPRQHHHAGGGCHRQRRELVAAGRRRRRRRDPSRRRARSCCTSAGSSAAARPAMRRSPEAIACRPGTSSTPSVPSGAAAPAASPSCWRRATGAPWRWRPSTVLSPSRFPSISTGIYGYPIELAAE